jgi:hypothetical protein
MLGMLCHFSDAVSHLVFVKITIIGVEIIATILFTPPPPPY